MKKLIIMVIITIIALFAIITAWHKFIEKQLAAPSDDPNHIVENQFGDTIIYFQNVPLEKIKKDCAERNGTFNECASPCPPSASPCIEMCVYGCELK